MSIIAAPIAGYIQKQALRSEASQQEDQARILLRESYDEGDRRAKEIRRFSAKQKLAYLKNGVTFGGSALDVVDETLSEGQKEVNSVIKHGQAQYDLGFRKADLLRRQGRAALISGFGQGIDTAVSYATGLAKVG